MLSLSSKVRNLGEAKMGFCGDAPVHMYAQSNLISKK